MTAAAAIAPAGPADVARLACLPGSILSALGGAGVARYYRFALASPVERVLVARAEGVVAGCVFTTAASTLLWRFARAAPAALARDVAGALASRHVRRRLRARLVELARGGAAPALPEVTQIFTDPTRRGGGVGAALLRAAEAALREDGPRAYCVHTLRDDNDAGIRFYRREGFAPTATTRSFGDHYLVMTKELP
jgi:ribosomal protein S18 acetylase RimI-like enzyme